ncbi:hypothetical protein GCM10009844_39090 [Nocardioides koreensis]|uniref:HNH endonuclease n=1 Tax=Nocardioides koreensis TaxID=433651 RepID=A0ABN3A4Q6_9ACTN
MICARARDAVQGTVIPAPLCRAIASQPDATWCRMLTDPAGRMIELDHRRPWPEGQTSTSEVWPACKTGHTAKHAPGFGIEQDETGSFLFVTGAGFRHPITPTTHPASEEWPELPEIQCTGTELLQAPGSRTSRSDWGCPGFRLVQPRR